jgi:hypothetical protein
MIEVALSPDSNARSIGNKLSHGDIRSLLTGIKTADETVNVLWHVISKITGVPSNQVMDTCGCELCNKFKMLKNLLIAADKDKDNNEN